MENSPSRLEQERQFHDRQAEARRQVLQDADLYFRESEFLEHEPWIRPTVDWLEPVTHESLLDLGSGHGIASVYFARRGAKVTALDLSAGYLRETFRRAEVNGVKIQGLSGNAEHLPFADASFGRIYGNAILHHLSLERAGREIFRVLKPGGRAVFTEPWGGNPLLQGARRLMPYPGKHRTVDEAPLRRNDLELLRTIFPNLKTESFQLLSMVSRLTRRRLPHVERWDQWLFQTLPIFESYARYIALYLVKN